MTTIKDLKTSETFLLKLIKKETKTLDERVSSRVTKKDFETFKKEFTNYKAAQEKNQKTEKNKLAADIKTAVSDEIAAQGGCKEQIAAKIKAANKNIEDRVTEVEGRVTEMEEGIKIVKHNAAYSAAALDKIADNGVGIFHGKIKKEIREAQKERED